jgi:chromosome segregation ATPase
VAEAARGRRTGVQPRGGEERQAGKIETKMRILVVGGLWCLSALGQDPVAFQPPTKTDIEEQQKESEAKIRALEGQLAEQRRDLDAQRAALAMLEAKLREGRGYVTRDEFAEYQKAVSAFQRALIENQRKQEDLERETLASRLRMEQALYENSEAVLASLMTNLSGLMNTASTVKALVNLPSPVAGSEKYKAAVKTLEAQSKKSRIPSIAGQLMGAFPQTAWLNTAVTLVLSPAFKGGKERDDVLKTMVCARDFAESVEGARKARVGEQDALLERMTRLRDRMAQTRQRMQRLVSGPGTLKEQVARYFGAMRGVEGDLPLKPLSALDDNLRAARREVASTRALLADYRQLMESVGEYQGRLKEFIATHKAYKCGGAETFEQDVAGSLESLERARREFAQMQGDTAAQEPVKVLDTLL